MQNGDYLLAMLALNGRLMVPILIFKLEYISIYKYEVITCYYRIALLQLATKEVVYLLDTIALTTRITKDTLRDFIAAVFSSSDTIKLGHCCTLRMDIDNVHCYHDRIWHSWRFSCDGTILAICSRNRRNSMQCDRSSEFCTFCKNSFSLCYVCMYGVNITCVG